MTDRFEELAVKLFMNPTVDDVAAALRAQHKAGQEAMREDIAMLCDTAGFPAFAKQIRALQIEEPTP